MGSEAVGREGRHSKITRENFPAAPIPPPHLESGLLCTRSLRTRGGVGRRVQVAGASVARRHPPLGTPGVKESVILFRKIVLKVGSWETKHRQNTQQKSRNVPDGD